jgi:hypothetical protein
MPARDPRTYLSAPFRPNGSQKDEDYRLRGIAVRTWLAHHVRGPERALAARGNSKSRPKTPLAGHAKSVT